ncbi:MAG: S1 RNA-binding domain-containing protein [Patescibacteria group bacterium]|nr:S1 RNA-binding domain-containing protein [Patescibacteria group bacterium]
MTTKNQTTSNLKLPKIKQLEIGSILEGKVIAKRKKEIYVDLSPYGIGRLYGIFYLQSKDLAQKVKIDDTVGVKIVGLDDGYGNYEIILQEIAEIDKWQRIMEYYRNQTILEVEIKDANRGGLLTEVEKITAFIPVSQLSPEYYPRVSDNNKNLILEHLKKFVGQKIKCLIASADPKTNKLVLSEKLTKESVYQEIINNLTIGDIFKVKVVGLSPFGIFVRFNEKPAMDGLIHVSEIPDDQVENLESSFKIGDELTAKLIQINNDKVSFSLKDTKPDPWVVFSRQFKEGDKIEGIIKEKNDIFGVVITNNVQGLIFENFSELEIDQKYDFIIESLKPKEKSLIVKLAND